MGFVKDVFNGITGKTAAKASQQAGQVQSDASKYAADLSQQQYEQTRADQMPWLNAGKNALGKLQDYTATNPDYNDIWGKQLADAMPQMTANSDMTRFDDAMGRTMAQNYQNGEYRNNVTPDNIALDPSYQFRKQQGMDGIQGSAAASGGLLSGAVLKSLNQYNSNLASQEYGNAWQRGLANSQNNFNTDSNLRSQGYNIFAGEQNRLNQTQRSDQTNLWGMLNGMRAQDYSMFNGEDARKYNQLANLAGVGQQTATNLGAMGAQNAGNVGDAYINAANAQANGLVGSANARTGGMSNLLGLGIKAAGMFI